MTENKRGYLNLSQFLVTRKLTPHNQKLLTEIERISLGLSVKHSPDYIKLKASLPWIEKVNGQFNLEAIDPKLGIRAILPGVLFTKFGTYCLLDWCSSKLSTDNLIRCYLTSKTYRILSREKVLYLYLLDSKNNLINYNRAFIYNRELEAKIFLELKRVIGEAATPPVIDIETDKIESLAKLKEEINAIDEIPI